MDCKEHIVQDGIQKMHYSFSSEEPRALYEV